MNTPKVFRALMLPVSAIMRPERNPNVMEPGEYAALVAGIRDTGFLQPILVRGPVPPPAPTPEDDARTVADLLAAEASWRLSTTTFPLVDGDHRLQAALDVGLTEIPCVVGELDDRTATLLQIGMNRLRGELDLGQVGRILDELVEAGASPAELAPSGYSAEEVDALLKAMRPDPGSLDDVGAVGSAPDAEDAEPAGTWELTVEFPTKKRLQAARKLLKRLGGGDLCAGLEKALSEEE